MYGSCLSSIYHYRCPPPPPPEVLNFIIYLLKLEKYVLYSHVDPVNYHIFVK